MSGFYGARRIMPMTDMDYTRSKSYPNRDRSRNTCAEIDPDFNSDEINVSAQSIKFSVEDGLL